MKNTKSLEHYLTMSNAYFTRTEKENFSSDSGFICYCVELGKGACFGLGENPTDAYNDFMKNKEEFIEQLYFEDIPIPVPELVDLDELPNGNFIVRTSPITHAKLMRIADNYGISLNLLANNILAEGSAYESIKDYLTENKNDIIDAIQTHDYRVRSQLIRYNHSIVKNEITTSGIDPSILDCELEDDCLLLAS